MRRAVIRPGSGRYSSMPVLQDEQAGRQQANYYEDKISQLVQLNLSQNSLREEALLSLSVYIKNIYCQLQHIDLSGNVLTVASCIELACALSKGRI